MSPWDSRQNNFDFLRLALAVLVIFSHAYPLGLGTEAAEPFFRVTHGQVTGGGIAVDSFFIMSGFLICASAQRSSSVFSFLKKRVTRIYPGFLAAALLTAFVLMPLAGARFVYSGAARVADFLLQSLRLIEFTYSNAFVGNPRPAILNGSIWSVSYEFWCYLGVALLLLVGALRRPAVIAAIFAVSWLVGIAFRVEGWLLGGKLLGVIVGVPHFWARLLPLYLSGVVFYLYRERIPLKNSFALVSVAALLVACFFQAGMAVAFPLAGAYLLFWFAFSPAIRLHRAGQFGDFSYGTYLYGFPVEQLLMRQLGGTVAPLVLFLLATPLVLLIAVGSWYGVERPFLRPARRKETLVQAVEQAL
jgi:peptidoglycan/LPS O-acetylase OafA/YrhL